MIDDKGGFQGKVAIVTGGASGIGEATARLLADRGASVVVADVQAERGATVAEAINKSGADALHVAVDVSQPDQVERLVSSTLDSYGRLDVLVNSAGIPGEEAPIAECSVENFDRINAVNFKGNFLAMKYAIPAMIKTGGGAIVNVASVGAFAARRGLATYGATKAAIIQLTKAAALEYGGQGVRANAVCPSAVRTPLMERFLAVHVNERTALPGTRPLNRFCEPVEVARLIVFLCSDDASYCTGAYFVADGGYLAG